MRRHVAPALLVAAALASTGARATDRSEAGRFSLFYEGPVENAWRAQVERARTRYDAYAARAYEEFLIRSGARARRASGDPAAERALAPILRDPTLRRNDIYVAGGRLLVFRGRPGRLHEAADFAPMPKERADALSLKIDVRMK